MSDFTAGIFVGMGATVIISVVVSLVAGVIIYWLGGDAEGGGQ